MKTTATAKKAWDRAKSAPRTSRGASATATSSKKTQPKRSHPSKNPTQKSPQPPAQRAEAQESGSRNACPLRSQNNVCTKARNEGRPQFCLDIPFESTNLVQPFPQLPAAMIFSPRNYLTTIGAKQGKCKMFQRVNLSPKNCPMCSDRHEIRRIMAANLTSKYMATREAYYIKIMNDIIFNETSHLVAMFKDYLIYDDTSDFMRKVYTTSECHKQIAVLCKFYNSYSKVFPNYFTFRESKYMYKNIRRKQKAIDARQEAEAQMEERRKRGDSLSSNRILASQMADDSTITLSTIRDPDFRLDTLMQSYIRGQSGTGESFRASRTITDIPLPELLEQFMRKDSVIVIKRNKASDRKPVLLRDKKTNKLPIAVSKRKPGKNIEVLIGSHRIVVAEDPVWTRLKNDINHLTRRSRSAVRPARKESESKKRASSNPRGRPKEAAKLRLDCDRDMLRTNRQILDVVDRHMCSSAGGIAQNSARLRRREDVQRTSARATPAPSRIVNLLIERRQEKAKKVRVTNMIHEQGTAKKSRHNVEIVSPTRTGPRSGVVSPVPRPNPSAKLKRVLSGGVLPTASSTKCCSSNSATRQPAVSKSGTKAPDAKKKLLAIDIEGLYRNLRKQRVDLNINTVRTDRAGRKETDRYRSVTPDCSRKYRSEYLHTLRENMQRHKQDIFILASKGTTTATTAKKKPKLGQGQKRVTSPSTEMMDTATTKDRTKTLSTFERCSIRGVLSGGRKLGNLFSKQDLYTHI